MSNLPSTLPSTLLIAAISDQLKKETPFASWDSPNTSAMILRVRLRTPTHLEGYVTLEIVLFRPMSYTQVWSRVVSTTVPIEGLASEDGLLPGFDYTTTETPWHLHANHDSCWREGLGDVFKQYEGNIVLFSGPGDWYEMVNAAALNLPEPNVAWERQRKAKVDAMVRDGQSKEQERQHKYDVDYASQGRQG